jgi:hypothetical protein
MNVTYKREKMQQLMSLNQRGTYIHTYIHRHVTYTTGICDLCQPKTRQKTNANSNLTYFSIAYVRTVPAVVTIDD